MDKLMDNTFLCLVSILFLVILNAPSTRCQLSDVQCEDADTTMDYTTDWKKLKMVKELITDNGCKYGSDCPCSDEGITTLTVNRYCSVCGPNEYPNTPPRKTFIIDVCHPTCENGTIEERCPLDSYGRLTQCNCTVAACPAVPQVDNAEPIEITGRLPGQTVNVTCLPGYEHNATMAPNRFFTCQSDGQWDPAQPPIRCTEISCGIPPAALSNSSSSTSAEVFYTQSVIYSCDTGYETLDGEESVTVACLTNGSLNGTAPTCQRVTCEAPPTANNASNITSTGTVNATGDYLYQDLVEYTCDRTYVITGTTDTSETIQCTDTKLYSGPAPSCTQVSCGAEPGTAVNADEASQGTGGNGAYLFTDILTYDCILGHELAGGNLTQDLTCNATGDFMGTIPECSPMACGAAPAPTAFTQFGSSNCSDPSVNCTYTQVVDYECVNATYEIATSGISQRVCAIGADNTSVLYSPSAAEPQCLMVCGPAPTGGTRSGVSPESPPPSGATGNYLDGDAFQYMCDLGYEMPNITINVTCSGGSFYDDNSDVITQAPICTIKQCTVTPAIAPHTVTLVGTGPNGIYVYEDPLVYSCAEGYEVSIGVTTGQLICQADTTFSPTTLQCTEVTCGIPPTGDDKNTALTNGSCSHLDEPSVGCFYGEDAIYTCNNGYEYPGQIENETIECLANRSFSPPALQDTCLRSCGMASWQTGGTQVASVAGDPSGSTGNYLDGDQIDFNCTVGYELSPGVSVQQITCQSSGDFTDDSGTVITAAPVCTVVICNLPAALPGVLVTSAGGTGPVLGSSGAAYVYGDILTFNCTTPDYVSSASTTVMGELTCDTSSNFVPLQPDCVNATTLP